MKILITGSEGFVGSRLVSLLELEGSDVIGLDIGNGYDITRPISIPEAWNCDIVVHLAAIKSVPASFVDPRRFFKVNYLATLGALEICRKRKVPIIHMSSYLYGSPRYLPIDEDHPLEPHNPYAQSKLLSEQLCLGYNRDFGIPAIILRPFNIYGPGLKDDSLIPTIMKQIRSGMVNLGDPEPRRDYLFIDDLCTAILSCLANDIQGVKVFNLGSGSSISVEDLARKIIDLSGSEVHMKFDYSRRVGEVMDCVADIRKIEQDLEWRPTINLDQGLKSVWLEFSST